MRSSCAFFVALQDPRAEAIHATLRAAAMAMALSLAMGTCRAETTVPPPDLPSTSPTTARSIDEGARLVAASKEQSAPSAAGRSLDLGPAVIRSAIAEADRDWSPARGNGAVFGTAGSNAQARIDRRFAEASIESCGGAGAFKFDPPVVGPLVFGGLLSFPWLLHAMATGRCRVSLVSPFADGAPAGASAPASGARPPDRAPFTDRVLGP